MDHKNNKFKVLIINTLYHAYRLGGAEISVQSLAEGLQKKGIKVAILTLGENHEHIEINDIPVYRLKLENIFWPFSSIERPKIEKLKWHIKDIYNKKYNKDLNKVIDEFNPTIIHTNNLTGFSVAVWDIAKRRNVKVAHTLRDYYLQCPKTNKFKKGSACSLQCWECKFLSKKKKNISQKVDGVVGISNSILQSHLDQGYFKNAIKKVIYNGFDIEEEPYVRTVFDKETFLNFGFIGQINQSKGIEVLMKNLTKFSDSNDWKLYVAGRIEPYYQEYLLSFFPKDRVEFLGYIDQNLFFKKVNVLIVPSLWEEPFGRVVVEGLLHKVVVLGSKMGGIKEILQDNEGFLFDPLNEELKTLLESVIGNPEKLNTYNFNISMTQKLSLNNVIKEYLALYGVLNN